MLKSVSADPRIERQGPVIVCRTISIPEAKLLKALGIHNAKAASYRICRRLYKRNRDLTPQISPLRCVRCA